MFLGCCTIVTDTMEQAQVPVVAMSMVGDFSIKAMDICGSQVKGLTVLSKLTERMESLCIPMGT